jgi:DNA-binding transcriptional MerR regulator
MKEGLYSIQFVSKLTGLNAHTIRAWEKRYQAVVPERNESGKRVFNKEEVDRLNLLAKLVNLGNTISEVAKLENEKLQRLLSEFEESDQGQGKFVKVDEEPVNYNMALNALITGLYTYKLDIISHELEKIKSKTNPRDFALRLLAPLLREVGILVHANKLSIAQEHSLSAILRFHIGHTIYQHYHNIYDTTEVIVFATPEGEMHEFGVMLASLICCHYKQKFIYLGTNMPAESLAEAANQIKSRVVVLGVSPTFMTQTQHSLANYLEKLEEELIPKTEIWLGGVEKGTVRTLRDNTVFVPTLEDFDALLSNYN